MYNAPMQGSQNTLRDFVWSIIKALPLELVVGLIVAGIISMLAWIGGWGWRKWRRHQFRTVFGVETSTYYLAFGSMIVHPDLVALAHVKAPNIANFPLAKPARPQMAFSAQQVASGCEIRAVAYLVSAFRKTGEFLLNVVTDESIGSRLDVDFIAFGALSNVKTLDMFANSANKLAEYDLQARSFVCKITRRPLHPNRDGFDYGIILKIHPAQFPRRTWICCAGVGEWGTSGAAWFLAKRWVEIAKRVERDAAFVCVIEVKSGQDESAQLLLSEV